MSVMDSVLDGITTVMETAKDLPTEKIAAVGLLIIGTAAIAKDLVQGNVDEAIETAKNFTGLK